MVKIDKVYTKGGDKGETSLCHATRVLKTQKEPPLRLCSKICPNLPDLPNRCRTC